jgi:hypothetical protein
VDFDALYAESKQDLQLASEPLFEFAEQQVAKRGAFLPFAAMLDSAGKVSLHGAAGEHEMASPAEILPLLHDGLRSSLTSDTRAVAVCEWVKITPEGGSQTDAIKVLVEHANGLTVAFYLPMHRRLLGKWEPGDMLVIPAQPEIGRGST